MKEIIARQKINDGGEWLNKYIMILENSCKDFSSVKASYEKAYSELRKVYKYIDSIIEYNNAMVISNLEFAFEQGLNDNLEHFKNPQKPTFMDEDYNECLREREMREREPYLSAFMEKEKLLVFLPESAKELYDAVIGYEVFLDTYIPKMAHYYGFVTGNTTLKKALKNYSPDTELSNSYKEWLSVYLDLNL